MANCRLVSAICLLSGLIAALLYALPYALDVGDFLSAVQKNHLFGFGYPLALGASIFAVWIRGYLSKQQEKIGESTHNEFVRIST